ncbi:MAG: ABC transporter ATP-binding protein, partial [Saprospiraceae bacterium]|nr:ABC transporter ATP-binding protein [Saprospiraceae bacterium]
MSNTSARPGRPPRDAGIFGLLKPYRRLILLLLLLTLFGNGINLILPKIIANAIDAYPENYVLKSILQKYLGFAILVFVFTWLQGIVQVYASEKVARDLRTSLSQKISRQTNAFIEKANPSRLLTNLTADVDSIKSFVSQAIVSIVSSVIIIVGACILLFSINWRLALAIVAIIPIIGGAFAIVLKKVRAIFIESRAVVDRLNKIINESILGAALIRVINSQQPEYVKFLDANTKAKGFGMAILKLFATLIPVIVLTANLATLTILTLGGHLVIQGNMTLGDFAAFNSYLSMLIFPILVIGFMSNVIAQATASYSRINGVLHAPDPEEKATVTEDLQGAIELRNVSLVYGEKNTLKAINLSIEAGTSLAVIGPTAAGKTQLLYLLTGLIRPTSGQILYDGRNIDDYVKEDFYRQVGFVFQDSILFNMSIRENIAFS